MDTIYLKKELKKIFSNNGLTLVEGEETKFLDLSSLRLISIIVDVENAFDIEIPDEYLRENALGSFSDFYELLHMLKPNN